MSESITAWLSTYFVASGEAHGADLGAIPLCTAKKKVQLVEFLTYGRDDVVWARVSDKKHSAPTRFSRAAVEEYTRFSKSHVLQDKHAIVSISRFRPFFARIPQGKDRMSKESFLALECDSVTLVGGRGEPVFGHPQALEADPDLREWSEGLKEHGGAGNCLKNRKQAAPPKPEIPATLEPRKVVEPPAGVRARAAEPRGFQQVWPICRKPALRRPPDDVAAVLASMKVDGDEESDTRPPRKRRRISALPSSPASQSSSQTRSATPFSEAEWPPSELHRDDTPPSSPRPASSPPTPPSPLETLSIVHETMLASSSPQLEDVSRKVPRPPQPFKSDRLLAEPIILAPDSDLSLSQSQSQSQSQPVVLSQLSQHERPPSLQVARKTHSRRRVEEAANLKEFIKAKLDGIGRAEEAGAVSWEMLYGILVETARDRGAVE